MSAAVPGYPKKLCRNFLYHRSVHKREEDVESPGSPRIPTFFS